MEGEITMDAATFQAQALQLERLMFHISWSVLGREADCADAVQEALTRAWQRRDSLRNPEKFKPWLMRILVNTCNDILRRQSRQTLMSDEEMAREEAPASDPLSVREAIECLKPEWRTVILLYYLEGCSVSEISQMLRIPQGTVKTRLMYARKRLCALMKEEWEGDA
ncbi:MAG: RNA polymerase sigma factor [Clostridiales bacterium]|nr:RNA polymerase sigma factor [Clostridiales bacterium]